MKAPYAAVRRHFPDTDSVSRDELYQWIGHPENSADANFYNTCAVRMSLALLGAGYPNPGRYPVLAGKYLGRGIETQQAKLSAWLVRHLGNPEKFTSGRNAEIGIAHRHGIVPFFSINGGTERQGHIAIVARDRWGQYLRCGVRSMEWRQDAIGSHAKCGFGR